MLNTYSGWNASYSTLYPSSTYQSVPTLQVKDIQSFSFFAVNPFAFA
jgi:hypothetical protein